MVGMVTRRGVIQGSASVVAGAILPGTVRNFSADTVRTIARDLAGQPYRSPERRLPEGAATLSYDQYRGIRFKQNRALWRNRDLPFQIGFFPCGFLYRRRVEIHEVWQGLAVPVPFEPDLFETDDPTVHIPAELGFAGFRVHAPINRPNAFDEFCVFLGASYFRAVGRNLQYGLSARGLALGTGSPGPEEFPDFRAFWLERPHPASSALIVHALLDSRSVAGAFRFTIRPGNATVIDVQSELFPRTDIHEAGVAPMTSMYFFADGDHIPNRPRFDDWRTAVHDSDGLAMQTGRNERLWRPLANPSALQFSAFSDANPLGFGLLQRRRAFEDFGDLQVLYGARPSLWIEPVGDWGQGAVDLVEIPTDSEYNDNIVAFWRGREKLLAGRAYGFDYRMRWGAAPAPDTTLARLRIVRTGAGTQTGVRVFVLDFAGPAVRSLAADARTSVELSSSAGTAMVGYSGPNSETGGWRISIDFRPEGAHLAELRCTLVGPHGRLTETWLYRWTA